jgi:hypothetical protein
MIKIICQFFFFFFFFLIFFELSGVGGVITNIINI